MRYIFILLFLSLGLSALAQQNIVESLQRNRAGEGTVTIHQDPKITGLIGSIYTGNVTGGEQKMLKARGYRVQVYAGNNSRVARNVSSITGSRSLLAVRYLRVRMRRIMPSHLSTISLWNTVWIGQEPAMSVCSTTRTMRVCSKARLRRPE